MMNADNPTISSSTHRLSLEDVLVRLAHRPEVDAVLLVGSTGQPSFSPNSDYDLLVVLTENPASIFKIVTTIATRLAELYFITESEIDTIIAEEEPLPANTFRSTVIAWVVAGTIVFDHSKKLTKLRELALHSTLTAVSTGDIYSTWYSLNYNYKQNLRYAKSRDSLYLQVLGFRLLYSIYDCLTGYFVLRKMQWIGDKDAIIYLEAADPEFLDLFRLCIAEGDLKQKFVLYQDLVRHTIPAEMGVWAKNATTVKLQDGTSDIHDALDFWNSLI